MKRLIVLGILLLSTAAYAGGLDAVLVPPTGSPQSGQPVEFSLYVHHSGGPPQLVTLPENLSGRIEAGGRSVEVPARALDREHSPGVSLGEGGFVKRRYGFTLPEGLSGPVRLEVREFATPGVLFLVVAGAPSLAAAPAVDEAPPQGETLDALLTTLHQPYRLNFSTYEPMYFLVGTNPEKSKFQISFKYRFMNPRGELAAGHPWINGLHFGYTQTSFWNLEADSAPFNDTSYKPELFFVTPNLGFRPGWMKGFFLQTGFMHESNGRGGTESRSTNYLYAKPVFIFYVPGTRWGMSVSPRFWAYVGNDNGTNPDLKDYRGYFELELKLGKEEGVVFGSRFRWAFEGASTQLDLTYPIRQPWFKEIDLHLHLQYVNALAESLLHYRERTDAWRLGFSLVR